MFGCQDGLLIYRDGAITKVTSPDPYGRIGNQAARRSPPWCSATTNPTRTPTWSVRHGVADEHRHRELRLVDLGTSYTFRSLGRGAFGEALVLGTDGALHVLDPNSGATIRTIPVLDPWTEPTDWQTARPALFVQGFTAYVTDPATTGSSLSTTRRARSPLLPSSAHPRRDHGVRG